MIHGAVGRRKEKTYDPLSGSAPQRGAGGLRAVRHRLRGGGGDDDHFPPALRHGPGALGVHGHLPGAHGGPGLAVPPLREAGAHPAAHHPLYRLQRPCHPAHRVHGLAAFDGGLRRGADLAGGLAPLLCGEQDLSGDAGAHGGLQPGGGGLRGAFLHRGAHHGHLLPGGHRQPGGVSRQHADPLPLQQLHLRRRPGGQRALPAEPRAHDAAGHRRGGLRAEAGTGGGQKAQRRADEKAGLPLCHGLRRRHGGPEPLKYQGKRRRQSPAALLSRRRGKKSAARMGGTLERSKLSAWRTSRALC